MSWFEGGSSADARSLGTVLQIAIGFVGVLVLAVYARKILFNTLQDDVAVPWGRDGRDHATVVQNLTDFAAVIGILILPYAAWLGCEWFFELSAHWGWIGRLLFGVLAAAQFPLALAAVTFRDDVGAALPRTTMRMFRAEPRAARIASGTAMVFIALLIASFWLATPFNSGLGLGDSVVDHTTARDAGRWALFVLRFVAFYAALVSFRVAGLLVREVPDVREALER